MAPRSSKAKPGQGQGQKAEYKAIAESWAKAERARREAVAQNAGGTDEDRLKRLEYQQTRIDAARKKGYEKRWRWTAAFWVWLLLMHAGGIYLFTSGFLLTRSVLDDKSTCDAPPIEGSAGLVAAPGNVAEGCWHPKTFDRAVVVLIDALRYDFTVPQDEESAEVFHNAFPFMHDLAAEKPQNAFLRPFIADPPTATMQRLKGLTTGTLPTFLDAGSNFAGTAIDEDNLLMQLREANKTIAHIGDDTWWSLFPGHFAEGISRAYDSFNVWDLHTVDNGVIEHIFPLMEADRSSKEGEWDLLIGHLLGVDHAGHRHGPDHAAMTAKLQQMDGFVRKLVESLDDDTLLIVMGDHGMDSKGDHGGESDDEVEAALWMYSKRPVFGRTKPEFVTPPATAKIRPVNQIDLVPTLALLLGIPIPYSNLGRPIEEAFAGVDGNDWKNLATVSRMAAAGVERYQNSYFNSRGITPASDSGSPADLWVKALALDPKRASAEDVYAAFVAFQEQTLSVCKDLWARFDVTRMVSGVALALVAVVILVCYSSRDEDDDFVVTTDIELDYAEKRLELMGFKDGAQEEKLEQDILHRTLLGGLWDLRVFAVLGVALAVAFYKRDPTDGVLATGATALVITLSASVLGVLVALHRAGKTVLNALPRNVWGWMAAVFTISQSIGFASNSYTVWEDSILQFFITTFGFVCIVYAFRIEKKVERTMAVYHSVAFILLARFASFSKLCREEQMPFCTSTYYASASSSTSSIRQLAIPLVVALILPAIVKSFLVPTRSWEGLAPIWVTWVFRGGLFSAAVYWVIDAADGGDWFAHRLSSDHLKSSGVYVAQTTLALAFIAGTTAYVWAPPSVSVKSAADQASSQTRLAILGYGNALGSHYLILPLNILVGLAVLTKPMGTGSLALMLWQILSLAEVVDLLDIRTEPAAPVVLAMLGNFYFFRTGHQATATSIQWDSAFVALRTLRYPWSPLAVALNTFGSQVLAAAAVPLVTVLWKSGPKQKGVLEASSRALGAFAAYYAVEAAASMAWAGHLRRHLMLFRVFSPRYMMAAAVLLTVDLLGVSVALLGLRSNALGVGEVFGMPE